MFPKLPLQLVLLLVRFNPAGLLFGPTSAHAEVNIAGYHVCTSDLCAEGQSKVQLGARLTKPPILLLPGTYSSVSPLTRYLPSGTLIPFLANNSVTFSTSNVINFAGSHSAFDEDGDVFQVTSPGWPVAYGSTIYLGDPTVLDKTLATGVGANDSVTFTGNVTALPAAFSSLFIPPGTFVQSDSASGSTNTFRGSIPDIAQLPNAGVGYFPSNSLLTYSSDACSPACSSSGGVCIPSIASLSSKGTYTFDQIRRAGTSFTCACLPGFRGERCGECQEGFYGPACKACDGTCGTCDDGISGTGGCSSVRGNSTETCGCLHGTCDSPNSCACSAGWTDPIAGQSSSNSSALFCSVCLSGFYEDAPSGDCLACPPGALTCTSATAALTCAPTFSLDSTGACSQKGSNATCSAGQYPTGSGCASCSAACTTCTGPTTDDCLRCASPRFSLFGTCVGYDAPTGICDSTTSSISPSATAQGVYVANNAKGECDSCPAGCLTCSIPSFSISSMWDQVQCQACQEGWMLQAGKCVQQCGDGFFLPPGAANINGTCEACDTTKCTTCISSATMCRTCATPGQLALPDGTCAASCPSGTFLSGTSCLTCSGDCLTCSGPGGESCLSCPSDFPVRTKAGGCSAVCPVSSFLDAPILSCLSCSTNCTSCIGPGTSQCLSCTDGLVLKSGECIPAVCGDSNGVVPGLGICFSSLLNDGQSESELLWWPFVLAFGLLLLFLGIGFRIMVLRQRAARRAETGSFADRLDEQTVMERVKGLMEQGRVGEAKSLEEVLEMRRAEEDERVGLTDGTRRRERKVRFVNPFSGKSRVEFSLPITFLEPDLRTEDSRLPSTDPTSPPALFKPYISPPSSASPRRISTPGGTNANVGLGPFLLGGKARSGSRESFFSLKGGEVPPAYSPTEEVGRGMNLKGGKRGSSDDEEEDAVDRLGLGGKGGERSDLERGLGVGGSTSFLPALNFETTLPARSTDAPTSSAEQIYISARFEVHPPSLTDADGSRVARDLPRGEAARGGTDPSRVSFWWSGENAQGVGRYQGRRLV